MKIAIDCGHTESTAGKRSPDGSLLEYEFTRDVGKRVKKYLERHGIEVLLIAPTGEDSLLARCRAANEWRANYFVSLHANAYGNGEWNSANGWEAYIYKRGGEAEMLADNIELESIPYLGLRNRGIKTANFTVLKDTDMPAVLIEHGFYTNWEENEKLKTDEFRNMCAIADSKGILRYLGIPWNSEGDYLTAEQAIDYLETEGVLSSPEYWKGALAYVKNLDFLFIQMANRLGS